MLISSQFGYYFFIHRTQKEHIPVHEHSHYELVYYLSGSGISNINGVEYWYQSGDYAFIKPGALHSETHAEPTNVLCLCFQYDKKPMDIANNLYSDNSNQDIYRIMQKIQQEMSRRKDFYALKLDILLQEIILEILKANCVDNNRPKCLSYIERYLQDHFAESIDLNTLADLSGYSYHRFRHIFKEIFGMSPYNYIIKLRLQNAAELLQNSSHSISFIAQDSGFSSESQFSSMFRQFYGCSPREYRSQKNASPVPKA